MKIIINGSYVIDLDKPVNRVGVVDLICPLKGWLMYREPLKVLTEVNAYMVAGREAHDAVLYQLRDQGCEVEKPIEVESACGRRRFRVDAVCSGLVVEFKRKYNASLAPIYLWQLKVYMSLLGIYRGAIVSLSDGYIKYVTINEKEAGEVKRQLMESLDAMCREERPGRRVGKWCRWCKFSRQCLNGQLI
jgi:CRISPR/Cas system-associated exonuclease Cas4 (RecB family)